MISQDLVVGTYVLVPSGYMEMGAGQDLSRKRHGGHGVGNSLPRFVSFSWPISSWAEGLPAYNIAFRPA